MDAVVLIGGCDKTVPAQLMGWLYEAFITQASEGCDFAFLKKNGLKPDH
jgi:hypothetical protein